MAADVAAAPRAAQPTMPRAAVSDALDSALADDGDEEEADTLVSQVLDEAGLELGSKVRAPVRGSDRMGSPLTGSRAAQCRQMAAAPRTRVGPSAAAAAAEEAEDPEVAAMIQSVQRLAADGH